MQERIEDDYHFSAMMAPIDCLLFLQTQNTPIHTIIPAKLQYLRIVSRVVRGIENVNTTMITLLRVSFILFPTHSIDPVIIDRLSRLGRRLYEYLCATVQRCRIKI